MPSTPTPFFSIITATHLRPLLLQRALQSLRAQSFADFEVIVVADAWDRGSAAVAVELLTERDSFFKRSGPPGPAASRNEGLKLARGEWVVFLDDDDSFAPHHLQALHAQATSTPAQVLFTDCTVITEDRNQPGIPPLGQGLLALGQHDPQQLWVKNFIPNHALAYRRSLLSEETRFDPHLASLEDWDFLLAVCAKSMPVHWAGGGVVMHKDYVNTGTRRGTSEGANNNLVVLDFLHIYRRWSAPSPELKAQRKEVLKGAGLDLPLEWF
ncbi:glycosyltransferase family A protein [Pelomonas sp. KK5]|uniref:glycosyltransferase family 2 protein n=1 Tax=Pelomonas sp. KK5 TaxID=1855730 RepID=UPI00097C6CB4|nr:glycosyltransferase family A protein [Pelomonas sp. KK5]